MGVHSAWVWEACVRGRKGMVSVVLGYFWGSEMGGG